MTDGVLQPSRRGEPVVELRGIGKRFGAVVANDDVSLALRAGEIHVLLGENGAGKTTLLSVLAGMVRPDGGEILVDGRTTPIPSPAAARRLGVGVVYQHFALVPTLTVAENALLGGGAVLDPARANRRLSDLLRELGFELPVGTEVRHLSPGRRQRAEIARALFRGARVLLLDEPTSVLSPTEAEGLFAALRRLADRGLAIALVTHKLADALAIGDRLTVLRRGRVVDRLGPEELDRADAEDRVVVAMFGAADGDGLSADGDARGASAPGRPAGDPVLAVDGLAARDDRGVVAVRDCSFQVRAGEVVGIAGVDGNGQHELVEVLAGQRAAMAGRVVVAGREATNRGVAAARSAGLAYLTDDRLGEGTVPGASVAENLALKGVAGRAAPFVRGPWLDWGAVRRWARWMVGEYEVQTPSVDAAAGRLSGGNLQRLLLARELAGEPAVLVAKEPTAGLDLRTTRAVHRRLRQRAAAGGAVLLVSADLDEVLAVADRVAVMVGGRLIGPLPRGEVDRTLVGRLMLGIDGGTAVPA